MKLICYLAPPPLVAYHLETGASFALFVLLLAACSSFVSALASTYGYKL